VAVWYSGGVERLDDVTGLGHLYDVTGGRTRRRGVEQSGVALGGSGACP
jgi:hypothetical protein